MQVRYSRFRLSIGLLAAIGFAWGGHFLYENGSGKWVGLGIGLFCVGPLMLLVSLRYLVDPVVLQFDSQTITYRGPIGSTRLPWRDVGDIDLLTVNGTSHLRIHGDFNMLGRASISVSLLESGTGGAEGILDKMAMAQSAPPPGRAHNAANAQHTPAPQSAPVAAGFGRKGM